MSIFEKKFNMLLEQPVEVPGPQVDDEIAMGAPDDLAPTGDTISAVDDVEDNPGISWRKGQNENQRGIIQDWINQVKSFTDFLNGAEGESIQRQLADADCDTLFNDVSRNSAKKITRIAEDLGALQQSLQGFLRCRGRRIILTPKHK